MMRSAKNIFTIGKLIQQRNSFGGIAGILVLLCVLFVPILAQAASGDWPTYVSDNGRSGFNGSETIINSLTAPNLKLKWIHTTASTISTQPAVANGVIYWGSWDGYEHATNLDNSKLWALNLGTSAAACSQSPIGVAGTATIATVPINGIMTSVDFVAGGNVTFYAINAKTRAVIWSTVLGSLPAHAIWSSPLVYNGSVYIGMSSLADCPLVQGQLIQMNASTGAIQHVFNTVPNGCTGAGVTGSPTLDAATGTIYFATGNPGSCSSPEPYAESLIEVMASNLTFIHHWQIPASQLESDTDILNTPTLFRATINGVLTQMVGIAGKNGVYYAFNRANINNGPVWQRQVARGGSCPTCGDGSISPSAWDGTSLYVAGGNTTINGSSCQGSLRKVDPATGNFIWEHCMTTGPVLGAVTVVPGVAVIGNGYYLIVVNTVTGATLFRYKDTNANTVFFGAASISNGVLYIGDSTGHLFAFAP
jgi:hypothetical protein